MVTRLSSSTRRAFQVAGPLCILAGLGLWFFGIVLSILGAPDTGDSFDEFGQKANAAFLRFVIFGFVGFVVLAAGLAMTRFGFLRPVSEITATETEDAVTHVAASARKGWGVKVRCRSCGDLDSEDARFCSSCGNPM